MKRLTEANKWKGWFRELSPELKCLWLYILDNCDNAGIWVVDIGLAEYCIGSKIDWKEAEKLLGERIFIFDDNKKWYITEFIEFQCGEKLNPNSPPHKKVIDLLNKYNLYNRVLNNEYRVLHRVYNRVCNTPKEEEEEKEIEEEGEKEVERGIIKGGNLNYIAEIYPELKTVKINKEEYNKLVKQFGIEETKYRIENVFYHIGKFGDKYKSHYLTILSWERKNEREKVSSKSKIKGIDGLMEFYKKGLNE